MLTIVIPANNEEKVLATCLEDLISSEPVDWDVEIVVVANGCTDNTACVARSFIARAEARGWKMRVLEQAKGSKVLAMDAADDVAKYPWRAYIDADIRISPGLLNSLCRKLNVSKAVFVSGTLQITGKGWVSRAYAATYSKMPYMVEGVPGCGLFAVNAAGRLRWNKFPETISDDLYVRLLFLPEERFSVNAPYEWPVPEGIRALVRVRRRQGRGVRHLDLKFPNLHVFKEKRRLEIKRILAIALENPVGFILYSTVAFCVWLTNKLGGTSGSSIIVPSWSRGR